MSHSVADASISRDSSNSVMLRLRNETAEQHKEAEHQPLQGALVRGEVTRAMYAMWLAQMLLVHRTLDAALHAAMMSAPEVNGVVTPEQFQELYLLEDLAFLGVDPTSVEPLPATQEFMGMIRATLAADPLMVLGIHYVLEGSKNGNKFIARAVRRSLGLEQGKGDRYLDSYGEQQTAIWGAFKRDMCLQTFTTAQVDGLVEAAKATFTGVMKLSQGVWAAGMGTVAVVAKA